MTRRILAPLDGSGVSESILPYLETLLRAVDANVTLLYVTPVDDRHQEQAARGYLAGAAEGLRAKGASVEVAVRWGSPAAEIAALAAAGPYDLIALCSHGRSGISRLLFGSVTEEVMHRATVPVFVVHPVERGMAPRPLRRLVVPLDGSHRSASIVPHVGALARALNAPVELVTVVSPAHPADLPIEVVSQNIYRNQKELQALGLEAGVSVLFGDPAEQVLEFADTRGGDLIAIATHGRTGLDHLRYGSVAETILRRSALPLLVLRTAALPKELTLHAHAVEAQHRAVELSGELTKPLEKGPYNQ
jgi:nucleotide-binding universal stress UspA family protein